MTAVDDRSRSMLTRAAQLFRAGQDDAATAAYEALLAVSPALPDSWYNLALLYRRARRFDDALSAYARALSYDVEKPEEVHLQRGVIFADDLALSDDARRELDAALALNDSYVPALLNLGNLHEDRGDGQAARDAYDRVLAIDPDNALALSRLIGLTDAGPVLDGLRARAAALLIAQGMDTLDRADLGFALGAALDRTGDYDAAFAAYAQANAASAAVARSAGSRYDRAAMSALVDRLIDAFPAAVPAFCDDGGSAPLFICGMFRSGSTLAEHLLARHSRVVAGGELDILPALIERHASPYPQAVANADLVKMREAYRAAISRRYPPGTQLTDKRPDNALHIGLIKLLFPAARIVHTVRDRADTCLSVYFLHAGPALAYATDLGDIAHYHAEQTRLMAHWRRLYPDDIFDLDYDRLVSNPAATLESLVDFCDLDWEPAMLTAQSDDNAVRTASNWQVRRPIYRESSGRARHYAAHLGALEGTKF
ncbi:sulfotransferase [Sphingomonas sp. SUN019]|uniref:tetratricopeptide repeat-containing sulfotransferase family protein n=1 Tax=Sphingomonas sp. SUN019 TaxID=2937788 RepID=UPI0021641D70|nr:tetratricopeptide repeat-containing sulfotransferase family protein [Sphingomonas sp. SUN019]UVO50450.1 sulfotransferase [Sphingomonas sp. SUN019]